MRYVLESHGNQNTVRIKAKTQYSGLTLDQLNNKFCSLKREAGRQAYVGVKALQVITVID